MADLIPFPRLYGSCAKRNAQIAVEVVELLTTLSPRCRSRPGCANGMPGHPPCRSPAELEAMLRAQADTTANMGE